MLNDTAKNIRALDSALLSHEFWRDPAKIQSYAQGILEYAGKPAKVHVHLGDSTEAYCAWNYEKSWNIHLPKLPQFVNEEQLSRLVYARAMFLRHEIGHAMFTDFGKVEKKYHSFTNSVDDTRVEYLFGNVFLGARRGFSELREVFFNNSKSKFEKRRANVEDFGMFIRFDLAGFHFNDTPTIELYKAVAGDLSGILDLPSADFIAKCKDLYDRMEVAVANLPKEDPKPKREPKPKKEKEEKEEDDFDIEDLDDIDLDSDVESEDTEDTEETESDEESEICEDGTEVELPEGEDLPSEQEQEGENSEGETQEVEASEESEDEAKEVEGEGSGCADEQEPSEAEEIFDEDESVTSYENMMASSAGNAKTMTLEELENAQFKKTDYHQAVKMNMLEASKFVNGLFNFKGKDGLAAYNEIVQHYSATINECVKFMTLKLQNRNRSRNIDRQLEGELDQRYVTDIVTSPNAPRAFYRTVRSAGVDSTVHILLDISGSMMGAQIKLAVTNAIVFAEVCNRIGAKFMIYFFTNGPRSFEIKTGKVITPKDLKKIYGDKADQFRTNGGWLQAGDNFDNRSGAVTYTIKDVNDKYSREHMCALGMMVKEYKKINKLADCTPEFQSTLRVFNEQQEGRNILFIINDGHFDHGIFENYDAIDISNAVEQELTGYSSKNFDEVLAWKRNAITIIEKVLADKDTMFAVASKSRINMEKIPYALRELKAQIEEVHMSSKHVELSREGYYKVKLHDSVSQEAYYSGQALSNVLSSNNTPAIVTYRSMIKAMRNSGWGVYGIGINSQSGISYVGAKNFTVIDSAEELRSALAKRLKEIF